MTVAKLKSLIRARKLLIDGGASSKLINLLDAEINNMAVAIEESESLALDEEVQEHFTE